MASLNEIKRHIASVASTRKVTSAMKMVASSKLRHAQTAIENMLPYSNLLEHILKSFLAALPDEQTMFQVEHETVKHVALIVYSSNGSLAGGFNQNVIKLMMDTANKYYSQNIDVTVYPIGRKVEEYARKHGLKAGGSYIDLADHPESQTTAELSRFLSSEFIKERIDRVELIYHHFQSVGSQVLQRVRLLPIELSTELGRDNDRELGMYDITPEAREYLRHNRRKRSKNNPEDVVPMNDDFIIEPDIKTVLDQLIPKLLNLMVYTALLDSIASEHASRMIAMQTATDNADELLKDLKLEFNKGRQQAITTELLDIVGGSVNN